MESTTLLIKGEQYMLTKNKLATMLLIISPILFLSFAPLYAGDYPDEYDNLSNKEKHLVDADSDVRILKDNFKSGDSSALDTGSNIPHGYNGDGSRF